MKRLGIFFFYEKNGDVDDFITYYLRDLARNLTELIVVCNGKLSKQGRAAFEEFTDQIIVRENKGLDVWAYKTALDHYGWQRLSEFDEVVMTNSTLMGPVRPLKEMFDAMAERTNLDFWGLTIHHGAEGNPFKGKHLYNYLPVHIQSHFIVYRKKFIQSKELQNYWDTMPMIESYTDSVQRYESVFTKQFADKGYQWDVYVNTDDLKEFTDYPLLVCPTRLLRDKKCPLFKRRSFMHDFEAYLNDTAGEPVRELYAYLRDHTDYPLELIWKNMIRTMHPYDFTRNLGLTRLIPERVQDEASAAAVRKNRRIALCMHLYFMDMLPQSCAFAANMPPETDVFISTNTPEKKQQIEEAFRTLPLHAVTVKVVENRGRDVADEHTEFTSGKEICKAASDAGISLYAPSEGTFFHFADYRTDEVNKLKGEPSAKKIAIVHSESYRTSFSYSALSHTYAMQMYNSSKKATENTVDELTGEQLTFENVVVCFADMDAYAGDSHDVQEGQYIKGGDAYLFTRGGVQVGRWEKTYPTNPLKLYTKSGEEMTLNRGKTYFALVDNDELSNFSYQ